MPGRGRGQRPTSEVVEQADGTTAWAGEQPTRHPPFQPNNEAHLGHGAYSSRRIGSRAREVAREVLELNPALCDDEHALAVSAFSMARARVELLSAAIEEVIERTGTPGAIKLGPRLVEAATAASREEAAQRASLGLDPRSLAELRRIRSEAALNLATIAQHAPAVLVAIHGALDALGLSERAEEFTAALAARLEEVAGDD